jgi:hypothetical protein
VENSHGATSVKHSRAEELIHYTVAKVPAKARSSRPDGGGPHRRIPERKQLNCCQAFIIASSLWPFR